MSIYIAHRRRKTSNALDTLVLTSERLVTTRRITEVSRQRIPSHWSIDSERTDDQVSWVGNAAQEVGDDWQFLPRDALHKRGLCRRKMSVCPTVCLSVTRRYCVEITKRIIKHLSSSGSHTILVFPYQTLRQYFDGDPLTGASNAGGY